MRKAELKEKGLNFLFAAGNMGIDAKYKLIIEKYETLNDSQVWDCEVKITKKNRKKHLMN